jgi:hypothetical protein
MLLEACRELEKRVEELEKRQSRIRARAIDVFETPTQELSAYEVKLEVALQEIVGAAGEPDRDPDAVLGQIVTIAWNALKHLRVNLNPADSSE